MLEQIAKDLEGLAAELRAHARELETELEQAIDGQVEKTVATLGSDAAAHEPPVVATGQTDAIDAAFGDVPAGATGGPQPAEETNVAPSDLPNPQETAPAQVPVVEPSPATLATAVEPAAQPPQPAEQTNVHASDGPVQADASPEA